MAKSAPGYIANFDSATGMLRATARYLRGEDFPGVGIQSPAIEPLGLVINKLPKFVREQIYIWSGWSEAVSPKKLKQTSAEEVAEWMVSEYPQQPYPAIAIGSASGALVNLCCALGMPWLPQTFLIPVRRSGIHPDEPKDDMEWGKEPGRVLLEANPQLQLHHMNDANQDRLMIQRMTYFRVKWLQLAKAYRKFIVDNLEPGGTIFVSECQLKWPTLKIGDRHIFQHGALGGATPEEFHEGSQRVEDYLQRYKSHRKRWDSPGGDADRPEAEWGFEPALRGEIEQLAQERGYRVRRILFDDPEHLSPLVADLYRWWNKQRSIPISRLLVGSFIVMEPFWTVRTGSVPFWMTFNKEPSADYLQKYLDNVDEPFDEIYMMLFSHGVDSVGLVRIEQWRELLKRARHKGDFVGVDENAYPRDFATFIRYYTELKRKIKARFPIPGPLSLQQLDEFLEANADKYTVQWKDHHVPRGVQTGA